MWVWVCLHLLCICMCICRLIFPVFFLGGFGANFAYFSALCYLLVGAVVMPVIAPKLEKFVQNFLQSGLLMVCKRPANSMQLLCICSKRLISRIIMV